MTTDDRILTQLAALQADMGHLVAKLDDYTARETASRHDMERRVRSLEAWRFGLTGAGAVLFALVAWGIISLSALQPAAAHSSYTTSNEAEK